MDTLTQRTKEIIASTIYINIASYCGNNQPWNTPSYAVSNGQLHFFWRSWIHSQHSKNIRTYPDIFISIYDSTRKFGDNHQRGVFIKAKAFELNKTDDVNEALSHFNDTTLLTNDFLGDSVKRLYKAIPEKIWLNDLSESKVKSETTQMRIEVALSNFI